MISVVEFLVLSIVIFFIAGIEIREYTSFGEEFLTISLIITIITCVIISLLNKEKREEAKKAIKKEMIIISFFLISMYMFYFVCSSEGIEKIILIMIILITRYYYIRENKIKYVKEVIVIGIVFYMFKYIKELINIIS